MAENLKGELERKKLNEHIDELVKIMVELGFQVKTASESEADRPIIQANNCIYHDLAQKYNEICEFDLALMSSLLAVALFRAGAIRGVGSAAAE